MIFQRNGCWLQNYLRYHPTWNLGILEPELLLLLVPDSVVPILRGCVPVLRYDSVMQPKDERIKVRPRPSPNSGVTVGLLSGGRSAREGVGAFGRVPRVTVLDGIVRLDAFPPRVSSLLSREASG